jgi:hypothetical protein
VDISAVLAHAQTQQHTAHALIDTLNIVELFRPVGIPSVVGSVRTGLMVDSDIDLIVRASGIPDIAACFDTLRVLALQQEIFEVVYFENKLDKPFASLYIDLGCRYENTAWRFNISIFSADSPHYDAIEQTTDAIIAALDETTRRTILVVKTERLQRFGQFRGDVAGGMAESLDLYRAIFGGGVTTYDEALAWIASNPSIEGALAYRPLRLGSN